MPIWITHPPLYPCLCSAGAKAVRQDSEASSLVKRWSSQLFYVVFVYLSGVRLKHGMANFRLLDRVVVDELLKFKEEVKSSKPARYLPTWVNNANQRRED